MNAERVADRERRELGDVHLVDRHGQRLGSQTRSLARPARDLAHELLELVARGVGVRLGVTALDVRDGALVRGPVRALPVVPVLVADVDRLVGAVEQDLALGLGQLAPRRREVDLVGAGDGFQHPVPVLERGRGPRRQRAVVDGQVRVGDDELGVDLEPGAEPVAGGARPVGRVEREVAGVHLVEGQPAIGAGEALREGLDLLVPLVRGDGDRRDALGELERRLDGVGDAPPDVAFGDEAVHDDLDGVLVGLRQADRLGEVAQLAVDPGPREPLAGQFLQELAVLALAPADDRREHLEPRALGQLHDLVHDLLGGLTADRSAAVVAMRVPHPREEHAQVVVDLGDGPHGRPGVARGGLLVDRDGRAEALDEVDVGLLHLAEELPGVGGQRLDVPALALRVDGVERERGLAGAGQPREHDQAIAGEFERDVAQVVLPRAVHDEGVGAHRVRV